MTMIVTFTSENELTKFYDQEGKCNTTSYKQKKVPLQSCAKYCSADSKCQAFTLIYARDSLCYLYDKSCEIEPFTLRIAY